MEYISTRNNKKTFTFEDVFIKGLAPDGGLFIPKSVKKFTKEEINSFRNLSYQDLAKKIIFPFLGDFMSKNELSEIIKKSYSVFRKDTVVHLPKDMRNVMQVNILELFHGPTLAFKDIAMQLIGNFYEYYLKKKNKKINIIVATSGDTGAAAIDAIKGKKNMNIFVLHPHDKISIVQRKIMTTIKEKNVFNIAIKGHFDDCQNLVKSMFSDQDFSNSINMSGVNSINWARIISQSVYYFYAYFQSEFVKRNLYNELINFSVPTGNFGDVYAGYIAKKMGLPINKLIIASNKNDILKRVINSGIYKPLKVEHTMSPSMDIQVASNFERLIFDVCKSERTLELMKDLNLKGEFKLQEDELKKIKEIFCSESLSEAETQSVISDVYKNQKVLIDPHTAVGIGVARKISLNGKTISLATAHPGKFPLAVKEATGIYPELPDSLKNILDEKEIYDKLPNSLSKIKEHIMKRQ